jgi:hypothetical protein
MGTAQMMMSSTTPGPAPRLLNRRWVMMTAATIPVRMQIA